MRSIVTGGWLLMVFALIVLINSTLIGNNTRRNEVDRSLNTAMDYAFDSLKAMYSDVNYVDYDDAKKEQLLNELMREFCEVLGSRIDSDGELKVKLIYVDLEQGIFHIGVTERFHYPYKKKTGEVYYEKAYCLA